MINNESCIFYCILNKVNIHWIQLELTFLKENSNEFAQKNYFPRFEKSSCSKKVFKNRIFRGFLVFNFFSIFSFSLDLKVHSFLFFNFFSMFSFSHTHYGLGSFFSLAAHQIMNTLLVNKLITENLLITGKLTVQWLILAKHYILNRIYHFLHELG